VGLLDGGLARIFRGAFAGIFLDATLHRRVFTGDDLGGGEASWVDEPVKASLDLVSERMRAEGFADADQRILVLAHGVAWPSTDDEITLKGKRWAISQVGTDPAQAAYDMRGRVVNVDRPAEATLIAAAAAGVAQMAAPFNVYPVEPISVSDFQNGTYALNGEGKTFAEMWEENTGPFGVNFIEGSVVPGIGWSTQSAATTNNSLIATAAHFAAMSALQGITVVLDYYLDQPAGSLTKPRIAVIIPNGDYTDAVGFYHNGAGPDRYISVYDYDTSPWLKDFTVPPGELRAAATLGPGSLAFSYEGGEAQVATGSTTLTSAAFLEISAYTSHDNDWPEDSTAILRRITIYPRLADEALPLLSEREYAFSDFKNGIYSINGETKALADLWQQDLNWDAFVPATDVVPGTGLTLSRTSAGSAGPVSTAALEAAVAPGTGYTAILDFRINKPASSPNGLLSVGSYDLPSFANYSEAQFRHNATYFNSTNNFPFGAAVATDGSLHRAAIAFNADGTGKVYVDGALVVEQTAADANAGHDVIGLWLQAAGSGANPIALTIEQLRLIQPVATARLAELSAS
jgi:hypothetical protein